jgi:hypothetical protein
MIREKIRASQLVNRLEDHVLDGVEMTKTQVTAALGLLKKCVPDLTSTTLAGDPNAPIEVIGRIERALVRANPKD